MSGEFARMNSHGFNFQTAREISEGNLKQRAPRRDAPGLCVKLSRLEKEGAGNAGCPLHPQPRVQSVVARECSRHGRTGTPGIPARNGFNGYFALSPEIG